MTSLVGSALQRRVEGAGDVPIFAVLATAPAVVVFGLAQRQILQFDR